jgi:4-hydroxythreonine-4-phosphate dehydrogenase
VEFVLIGPRDLWRQHAEVVARTRPELASAVLALIDRAVVATRDPEEGTPARLGETNGRHGAVAIAAIEEAVKRARGGALDAIVTAPLNKDGIHQAGSNYPGHTEMLRDLCGAGDVTMAFAGGGLYVALATIHVPLRAVFDLLTPELILRRARHLDAFVRQLGIAAPRIALCGLNPHASEGGLFGDEEARVLEPAVAQARSEGIALSAPMPPDTVFFDARRGRFDAVLALYHDQGLIAVKTVAFEEAVNVTLGLPIIRTSPDHGTAFDIAGQGTASTGSMAAAIALAIRMAGTGMGSPRRHGDTENR